METQEHGDHPQEQPDHALRHSRDSETILCRHCRRTAGNGIVCQGMCVADSDY